MRDEGVIYVAGHPLLNRRCTRLPGCIRLRNDLYCVEWGVKLYSLTHSRLYYSTIWRSVSNSITICTRVTERNLKASVDRPCQNLIRQSICMDGISPRDYETLGSLLLKLGLDERDTSGAGVLSVLSRLRAFADLRIMIFMTLYRILYRVQPMHIVCGIMPLQLRL